MGDQDQLDLKPLDPVTMVTRELERRVARNPRYSMRAFARDVGLPSGRMSELLSRKREITADLARKVAPAMFHDEGQRQAFLTAVDRNPGVPQVRIGGRVDLSPPADATVLDEAQFSMVADWHHLAILNLIRTKDYRPDPAWIARRLGIEAEDALRSLETLEAMGLIEMVGGVHRRTTGTISTTHNVPSVAVRLNHKQRLAQAVAALDELDVAQRDITGVTLAMRPDRLAEVKRLVQDFRRKVADLVADDEATEVYYLNVQVFPVSRR